MKILYGVVGEGMGHAIRSQVVIDYLLDKGHEFEIVASGQAYSFLASKFKNVNRIWGLSLAIEDNKVKPIESALNILGELKEGWPDNFKKYFEITKRFNPDLVISDFETWSVLYAIKNKVPLICLDNIQAINRCTHPNFIFKGHKAAYQVTKGLIKTKIPSADQYIISSFFKTKPKKKKTIVVPPIIRPMITSLVPETQNHILVYQSSGEFTNLLRTLEKIDFEFKVYGLQQEFTKPVKINNVTLYSFSEETFIEHLRTCSGVVAPAGFNLIVEALWLKKPYLAIPLKHQIEQLMNARYIQAMSIGSISNTFNPTAIENFIADLPNFTRNYKDLEHFDPKEPLQRLESIIEQIYS